MSNPTNVRYNERRYNAMRYGASGVVIAVIERPRQGAYGRISRPTLADPILMARPEAEPLRALVGARSALSRRLRQ